MITKEEYVLIRIKSMVTRKAEVNEKIKPLSLLNLIEQWAFDYEMDKLRYINDDKIEFGLGSIE